MRITIHRGINQIGGCITGIESASGMKILIDLGHNLPDTDGQAEDEYEVPENLDRLLDGVSAVFYTHYHGDHIAFEAAVAERGVDQYLGKLAKKIKLKFYAHMQKIPQEAGREKYEAAFQAVWNFKEYLPDTTVSVGDIRVTPYYVSHSAADAYMFVIECDGKKILHTGDFRDHGYLGKYLKGVLRIYVVKCGRQSQPASATLQNIFEKDLLRCQEIELFPRPCVDFLPDFGNFPFCDGADVRPLWYILPYQLVGVFYCPLLPRAIGIGKIHRYVQFLGYPFVLRELAAVVRGYGLQGLPFVRQEQPPHGFRHRPGLLPMLEFLHEQEVRAPFRQRQYGVAVPVHDEVHLPISETPAVRLRRTLVYAYAVTDVRSLGLMSA